MGISLLIVAACQPNMTTIAARPTLSPSRTPLVTPISTLTVSGAVQSTTRINVWDGPGTSFNFFSSLAYGNVVQIIGQDSTEEWLNIRLEDGREGWILARFVSVLPATMLTPDLTALFPGTPRPTATPKPNISTPTPPATRALGRR